MTILESIQAAEERAEKLRIDATKAVDELLAETKIENTEMSKRLLEEAHQKVLVISKESDNTLLQIEKDINMQYILEDEKVAAQAQKNESVALDFILERIIDL